MPAGGVARYRLWVIGIGVMRQALHSWPWFWAALPAVAKLAGQLAQRLGDQARVCQRREVVACPARHWPAEFPRSGCLVLVCVAQLQVSGGGIGPLRRRRVNLLEHG